MDMTNLIEPEVICLDLKANSKEDVLIELVEMLDKAGKLTDKQQFLKDIWRREEIGNTGFEEGIAIPHAKSRAVALPAVVVGISRQGIDYGAEDGQLSDVFFMLASPDGEDHHHIEVLAQISSKLIEEGFVEQLKAAESVEQALALFIHPHHSTLSSTPVIDYADYPPLSPMAQRLARVKEHLLFGTSHMMPFIVAGGVLLSLSVMMSGHGAVPEEGVLADIAQMGIAGLTLFTVVLGGYIAYSMADKPGLAPGMIGTWIAINQYQTGFIGAIIVGFFAGFVVRQLKRIALPDSMSSLGSIFIYPLVGTFVTCGAVMWLIGAPIASSMLWLNQFLASMADSGKVVLGAVLGAMTAFDMGGPINKVATLFAQTQVNTQPWLMGGVGIAICTPPLGMALATLLSPSKFKRDEREAGKAAGIMGMIGISEGAIPFAAADPARVLPAIIAGGIVGNVIGFLFQVLNHAPWGGWIVLPVVDGKLGYILGTIAGALTTALIAIALKKTVHEQDNEQGQSLAFSSVIGEGQADILAVTSCPSGVAHTFLAAKSLEKAACLAGVKIKVETQGANGIINRITAKDVQRAKLVIFAHDVAIKEPERFKHIKVIDVTTKDAILNAAGLVQIKR
ncbi:PTS sugar transporter subunit IIA [Vibrio cholerae]|uniref:fructose-specific PTS transporter subunit EIIC n=1 Tax=Vibrio cholerae TaxID=666 RepID=UPI0011EE7424|nr:fructose-specific PTS transporter subunit EIIC [Vibrio cholerae]EGR2465338.1 PTS fructose transporter subunit IIA [Vibrio cholerae]ELY5180518.1 PTS sugar transporter subunit IIA [Vibrio cholerae]TYW43920.1 PTS fructose transporter subunit IIA [Vibrio cholerae]TYW49562.1 PTS fructose transporter subunit IIA [Vibrio cholerae]